MSRKVIVYVKLTAIVIGIISVVSIPNIMYLSPVLQTENLS